MTEIVAISRKGIAGVLTATVLLVGSALVPASAAERANAPVPLQEYRDTNYNPTFMGDRLLLVAGGDYSC